MRSGTPPVAGQGAGPWWLLGLNSQGGACREKLPGGRACGVSAFALSGSGTRRWRGRQFCLIDFSIKKLASRGRASRLSVWIHPGRRSEGLLARPRPPASPSLSGCPRPCTDRAGHSRPGRCLREASLTLPSTEPCTLRVRRWLAGSVLTRPRSRAAVELGGLHPAS